MTLCIYARVSTDAQELEGQVRELKAEAERLTLPYVLYQEKVSGRADERTEYDRMLKETLAGDIILVWALDRFSRAERFTKAVDTVLNLEQAGIAFRSLKEPFLNTPPSGQSDMARDILLSILPVIAKWEAKRRSERTRLAMQELKEGRRPIKGQGHLGRPIKVTPDKAAQLVALREQGLAWKIVAQRVKLPMGTCRATYSAIKQGRWKSPSLEKVKATEPSMKEAHGA